MSENNNNSVFQNNFYSEHFINAEKEPMGGFADGLGFTISWQRGQLKFNENKQALPNGAFVYDIVAVARDRVKFFQESKYKNEDYKKALKLLTKALEYLKVRM
jgi:hypothetical protein